MRRPFFLIVIANRETDNGGEWRNGIVNLSIDFGSRL